MINSITCLKEVKIYFNSIFGNIINKYTISGQSSKVLFFDINELNNFIKNRENNYIHLYTNSDNNKKKELEKIQSLLTTSMNNMYKMRCDLILSKICLLKVQLISMKIPNYKIQNLTKNSPLNIYTN